MRDKKLFLSTSKARFGCFCERVLSTHSLVSHESKYTLRLGLKNNSE